MSRRHSNPHFHLLGIWLLLFTAGCGASKSDEALTGAPTAKEALQDLRQLLEYVKNEKKNLPTRVAQVQPIEPLFPGAYLGLLREDIVYVWGLPLHEYGADKVLAFDKKAPSEGGWVLMQDGTLKQMTADEFNATPRAR